MNPRAPLPLHRPLADHIHPSRTALVVIDVQNDFCHRDGYYGRIGADLSMMPAMAEHVASLVAAGRVADMLILWVRASYDLVVQGAPLAEILSRGGEDPVRLCEGSWGAQWFAPAQPIDRPGEVVLTKHRFSAFWDSPIDLYLRSNGIESVVMTGVVTSGCVESSARDAFFRNFHVVIANNACASYARELHDASLRKLAMTMSRVVDAESIVAAWEFAGRAPERAWHTSAKAARAASDPDPARTALLVIDMQNDFCHPDGLMARLGNDISFNRDVVPIQRRIIAAARAVGVMVIHVHAQYGELNASPATLFRTGDEPALEARICLPNSWGAQPIDDLAPHAGEPVVIKHRYSAFVDTRLETLLRSNGIRTVVVIGTATPVCVESTVRDGMMRDYRMIVPREAVACRGHVRHLHEASLETLGRYFAKVCSAEELVVSWQAGITAVAV
ncbi:MAG: cysteine hydrolase family protein [Burkholderiales bacterium]